MLSRAHLQENSIATRAFYRTVLMRGFHVLVMLLCTRSIKDTQCGFKLFTRKTADLLFQSLHLERWAFDIEIIFLAEKMRIPMSEVRLRRTTCEMYLTNLKTHYFYIICGHSATHYRVLVQIWSITPRSWQRLLSSDFRLLLDGMRWRVQNWFSRN